MSSKCQGRTEVALATGFVPHKLDARPEGYPNIGYEFEFAYPPRGKHRSGYGYIDIHTYRVVGWERQVLGDGSERISVRVEPIASRTRRVITISFQRCNLGHEHEVFEYDDNAPLKGVAPEVWGTASR